MDAPCPGPRLRSTTVAPSPRPFEPDATGEAAPLPDEPSLVESPEIVDLALYLAGALPEETMRSAEEHIFGCSECRERLMRLRDLKGMLEDRALWLAARPPASAKSDPARECLSAAETLLALEGRPPTRVVQHLARCVACRADISAVDETTHELATGRVERPASAVISSLKGLSGMGDLTATHADTLRSGLGELARPIIVPAAPAATVEADEDRARRPGSKRTQARRLSPRPSKRVAPVTARRQARPVAVGGIFAFASAAAAAAIVAILAAQGPAPETAPGHTEVARNPEPRRSTAPVAPVKAPAVAPSEKPAPAGAPTEEPLEPPVAGPPAPAPATSESPAAPESRPAEAPSTTVQPAPAPSEAPAIARSEPREPSPLETAPADDAATVDLDRVAGTLAIKPRGEEKWATVAPRAGRLALKQGDRLRASGGASLALDAGAYEITLAPRTEIVVRGAKDGPILGLAEGRLLCEVESFPAAKGVAVATHAGQFTAGGRGHASEGAAFSVVADERRAVCSVQAGTVTCRGSKGEPRALGAGFACAIPRGGVPAEAVAVAEPDESWARGLRPERQVIYLADFERNDLAGFGGTTTDQGAFRGAGRSLVFEPLANNKFWGLSARAPKGHVKSLRAAPDVRIQLSVWLEKDSHLLLQLLNERQSKLYKKDFGTIPGGRWVTVGVSIMDLDTYFDPGKSPVREGDVFNEIEVLTANPGERFRALLDDVVVYRKIAR